jgi:hypothetical protein
MQIVVMLYGLEYSEKKSVSISVQLQISFVMSLLYEFMDVECTHREGWLL